MNNKNYMTKKIYEEKGGIRFGDSFWLSSNYSWPFANIEIFKDKIILSWGYSKIVYNKKDIRYIEKYRGLFSKGIRIKYNKKKNWKFIIFWSPSVDNLLSKLKKGGYKIK